MRLYPKLTDKQIFALVCVQKGAVRFKEDKIGWRTFARWVAYDSDITGQIKSLRRRGLVRCPYPGISLTTAGEAALAERQKASA